MTIVFDIDGTLASNDHRKHHLEKRPKDWDAFFADQHLDPVNEDIREINFLFATASDRDIVICTGRGEEYREVTEAWLRVNNIAYDRLYMRKHGDRRGDDIVKLEMLAQMRADGFEPFMVFDDRNRVVNAWRSAGVRCLQVADGDF